MPSAVRNASHIAVEMFNLRAGTQIVSVPYQGGANQAMTDLLAGRINLMFNVAAALAPYVSSGKLTALAVGQPKRTAIMPDVPTMEEAGVPGLYASFWHGLWVPKGTPKDVVARLTSAVRSALADPAVRQRFADQGHEIASPEQQSPEALGTQQQAEIKKWWPIIKAAGIKGE